MPDPFKELGLLAHEQISAAASKEVHARGRQRLMATAGAGRATERTRRGYWGWTLALAALAALLAGSFAWYRSRPLDYQVLGASSFSAGYLSAASDRAAQVRFEEGSELRAAAGTRLRIEESRSDGARVLVERGTVVASIQHGERTRWRFGAGPFLVHVVGTRLTLRWDPVQEEIDLSLHEGAVEVEGPLTRGRFAVIAGQRFRASLADDTLQVESLSTLAVSSAPLEPEAVSSAPLEPEAPTSAQGASERGSNEPVPSPLSSSGKASSTRATPVPGNTGPAEPRTAAWPELVRQGQFQAVVDAAQARGLDGCLSSCSAAEVRALADAARYTGHSSLAERSLLSLRKRFPKTGESAAAALLLGRISESRGRTTEADQWYHSCLQEAPNGQFAADALAGRTRMAAARRGSDTAKPVASGSLRQAPAAPPIGGLD